MKLGIQQSDLERFLIPGKATTSKSRRDRWRQLRKQAEAERDNILAANFETGGGPHTELSDDALLVLSVAHEPAQGHQVGYDSSWAMRQALAAPPPTDDPLQPAESTPTTSDSVFDGVIPNDEGGTFEFEINLPPPPSELGPSPSTSAAVSAPPRMSPTPATSATAPPTSRLPGLPSPPPDLPRHSTPTRPAPRRPPAGRSAPPPRDPPDASSQEDAYRASAEAEKARLITEKLKQDKLKIELEEAKIRKKIALHELFILERKNDGLLTNEQVSQLLPLE